MTLNKAKGRMFKSVGWTWNPLAGCNHACQYCYASQLMSRWGKDFIPKFRPNFLKDQMPNDGSWIFVGSMGDTFCKGVEDEWILKLFDFIKNDQSNNLYLLQTKNPRRFADFLEQLNEIKHKVILGTTLETTEETPWSKAPNTFGRSVQLGYLKEYEGFRTFLSLEPLADFNLEKMMVWIEAIKPEAIEIGLENYTHFTTPPPEWKIVALLHWLKEQDIEFVLKENLEHLTNSLAESIKD